MMQAGNFTWKLVALVYIRKQKEKVQWIYFVGWRVFGPFFCTFKILVYFFFFKSVYIYLKAKFKIVAVLGQKSSLQSSPTAVWNYSANWREKDGGDHPMT